MLLVRPGSNCSTRTLNTGPGHPLAELGPWLPLEGMLLRKRWGCTELMGVMPARSLRWPAARRAGLLILASPRQQVQTGGSGGHPHPGQRGHWQAVEQALPSRGSSGPAHSSLTVRETCWVGSCVFPCKTILTVRQKSRVREGNPLMTLTCA